MTTIVRCLLVLVMLVVVAAPVYSAAAADPASPDTSYEVVQIWECEMDDGTTEEQVEAMAQRWLNAIRQTPGGAAAKLSVLFPAVVSDTDQTDFYLVLNAPSFANWGKLLDASTDDSPIAKADELLTGKVTCPDSMLWEAHNIQAN